MPKPSNFHIIAADTSWNINTRGEKSHEIALWLKVHHAKRTDNKLEIQRLKKKSEGVPVFEENDVIYVIPEV